MAYEIDTLTLRKNLDYYFDNRKEIDDGHRNKFSKSPVWILIFGQDVIDTFTSYSNCVEAGEIAYGKGAGFLAFPIFTV